MSYQYPNMTSHEAEMDDASQSTETGHFLERHSHDEHSDMYGIGSSRYEKQGRCSSRNLRIFLICALVFPIGILLGSAVTYYLTPHWSSARAKSNNGGLIPPAGSLTQVWQHNLTFSQAPTPESEAAWASIVPAGRGFIHQPEIAPFISNIAAFHQLHCLHAVMVAYYAAMNSTGNPAQHVELFGTRVAMPHIRHCFDYLRRSIMCAADTNLEVVDRVNHTTNGWGQEKKCRNWDDVFEYAERYANSTEKNIVT